MTDVLFDTTGDIDFTTHDIVYGESTRQHQADILLARQGDYKSAPAVGVGIEDYLKGDDDDKAALLANTRLQFSNDGMKTIKLLQMDGSTLKVNASYATS